MPTFFKKSAQFGAWLAKHAATESQLIVGFYKRDSGQPSLTKRAETRQARLAALIGASKDRQRL
jgi:uncharacterized protein YdeI (YjbR/CyaY-like superfamily)